MSDCTFDKWNTTSKAVIIGYFYNCNNMSIVVQYVSKSKTLPVCHDLENVSLKFKTFKV